MSTEADAFETVTQPATAPTADPEEATENTEKHGNLFGGAATEEALASSRRVLSSHRGKGAATIGLQQWFSPPEAAGLIASVFGDPSAVLDPTAGSGALLAPFSPERRFGIEIDRDHATDAPYNAIGGDVQKVAPMLRAAGLAFPAIALNPPFGLSWRDPAHAGGEASSTRLAYLWALDLLCLFGQGAMICGTERLAREILSIEEGRGVYAVVDVEGPLFDGVDLATSIAFFVRPENRVPHLNGDPSSAAHAAVEPAHGPARLGASRSGLPGLSNAITAARDLRVRRVSPYVASDGRAGLRDSFETVGKEHERRRREAEQDRSEIRGRFDARLRGSKLGVSLSAYAKLALRKAGALREIELLNGQHVSYFGQNKRAWQGLLDAEQAGHLTVDPALRERAEAVIADAERAATPLFPLRPQMRLGWLSDLARIPCRKDDPERGFVASEEYPLSTASKIATETERRVVENRQGEPELRRFETERKLLEVRIGQHSFDEGEENIAYLAEHFELPDPGCVATRHPEQVRYNRGLLKQISRENGFTLKLFQLDHLSRLLTKGRGMLAFEQGLGKTLCQMTLAEAQARLGAEPQALFVVPQDLLGQWSKESKKFFGRRLEVIANPAQARDVARRVADGERGWWITYFEALSVVGRKKELLPHRYLDHRMDLARRLIEYKKQKGLPTGIPESLTQGSRATTADACPKCGADTSYGWNKEACRKCGYVHRSVYVKTAASHLTTAFKRGVKCVDEVSEIRGDDSLRSKAIRGMAHGPHNYGATGTPVSNFVNDSFHGLMFCLGASSPAFPYSHGGGKQKFENDFCVIEYLMGKERDGEGHLRKRRKVLPRVTNVSQFWRLTQPGVSRCRKEQTGEPIVERTYHPIRVPMGASQKQAHEFWLSSFEDYFTWKHPDHHLVKQGLVEKFAAALGQLWRLETAATLPASDAPSREWPRARGELGELSNWTPANLKVLELAMEHAAKGEKVLIGSDLIMTGKWLADRLCEKGAKAVHITEEKGGKVGTKNPRKRAREVEEFVSGDAQVLCAGVNALKLGHNLDCASTVIVSGLPYSFMVLDQFLARVHRLTSKRAVSVYAVIPKGSLAERKWDLLKNKGAASDLAFDGELSVQPEKPVDWSKVLREMKERGIRAAEGEDLVLESDVEAAWNRTPALVTPASAFPSLLARSATAPPSEQPPSLLDLLAAEGSDVDRATRPSGQAEQLALFDFGGPADAARGAA